LLEVGQHFKFSSQMRGEIMKLVLAYLVDEEILPEEALERTSSVSDEQGLELKRLEYQEKDKAMQLKLKELEIREKQLTLKYKAKELELMAAKSRTSEISEAPFDVGKHVRFIPPFQEMEVDKYFIHFENISTS